LDGISCALVGTVGSPPGAETGTGGGALSGKMSIGEGGTTVVSTSRTGMGVVVIGVTTAAEVPATITGTAVEGTLDAGMGAVMIGATIAATVSDRITGGGVGAPPAKVSIGEGGTAVGETSDKGGGAEMVAVVVGVTRADVPTGIPEGVASGVEGAGKNIGTGIVALEVGDRGCIIGVGSGSSREAGARGCTADIGCSGSSGRTSTRCL